MNLPSGREKCVLLLSLLVVLVVLLLASVLVPWWSKMERYGEVADQAAERIGRYERLIASRPAIKERLQKLRQQLQTKGYFIKASSPELGAAELQKRVKKIVSAAGGTLVSTQNVDTGSASGLRKIEIKVRMKGDVGMLAKVLHALEGELPVVMVENLSLRSRRTVKGRRQNRVEGYALDITFNLVGHMLGGAQ